MPNADTARAAVTAAFSAWQEGQAPGVIAGSRPMICVVDNFRKPGQGLKQFEVVGEVASEFGRGYAVRVTFENPDEQALVRYLAIGIEPIWVYRQEDFENMAHWMHKMDDPASPPDAPAQETKPLATEPAEEPDKAGNER